uniref:Secreted RxLR effector protein 8 n=1 Tax=Plasmopara viticola TaxID=143451 RepID=RLR8_PLAVT|nr:RecName: Full=Secreted RxLR effector protein 8; Flags: Precursor [Plasmopara viticola]
MRGTLATALLLVISSRVATESNQLDPQQLSNHVVGTYDKIYTKSSPRRFLRGSRKQRDDLAPTAADENRTINNAIESAMHGITFSGGTTAATRNAAREVVDINAFSKRPRLSLNVPPSETSAHLIEAPTFPQRNSASTSTTSDIATSSSRTSNQRTPKTQASLDMSHKTMTRKSSSKNQFKKSTALKSTKRKVRARKIPAFVVNKVYTLYFDHVKTKSLGFDPTVKETKAMLSLYFESSVDPFYVSAVLSNFFRYFDDKELTIHKKKLGTTLTSALSTLAALELPPGMLKEIERPFVWYASLKRWRVMYCDFFEFVKVNSDKITNSLPNKEFYRGETSDIVRDKLLATLKKETNTNTRYKRKRKLKNDLDDVLKKYNVKEEIGAAIRDLGEQFLKADRQTIPSRRPTRRPGASHIQPSNQRTDLTPHGLQVPGPEKNSYQHIKSKDHARKKRPRSSS